jgi:hypothetical protein
LDYGWVNRVKIFLDPLKGKFYTKYFAQYLEMDFGGSAKF